MNITAARKPSRLRNGLLGSHTAITTLVFGVIIIIFITRQRPNISLSSISANLIHDVYHPPLSNTLFNAWERSNETCIDWLATQRENEAYLDAYVVGSQKSGTTQLTHMLQLLEVRRKNMIKQWNFYNHLTADGVITFGRFETDQVPPLDNITKLQQMHYQLGFPNINITIPPSIDHNSNISERTIVIDSTVEYFHMEKAAYLSSILTPNSKIIIMIRDPSLRALSQYNMLRRNVNLKLRKQGLTDRPASAEEFDEKVRAEIEVLRECGYDDIHGTLRGSSTVKLIHCMRMSHPRIDDVMYVLRGVYHIFIPAWRRYFKDHRILYVPFSDLVRGNGEAYQKITKFLCIKPFPEKILTTIEVESSELSHGARAARDGLENVGPDSYSDNDRYLPTMLESTQKLLNDFYGPGNQKLEQLLGRPMF